MKHHFETLGLQEGASQQAIQEAYDRLSRELDPKNNDNQEFFKEEYKKVQEAYEALYSSSILATEKGAKSYKNETIEPGDMSPKSLNKLLNNSLEKRHNKLRIKQNITILFLIFSIGFNVFTYIKVQGDNNAISVTRSIMNQTEDYSEEARRYRNQAEEYMDEASSYMSGAEEHSDNSYYYMNRAEEHSNNAYYYSNQ